MWYCASVHVELHTDVNSLDILYLYQMTLDRIMYATAKSGCE